jgi:hypothetical protein
MEKMDDQDVARGLSAKDLDDLEKVMEKMGRSFDLAADIAPDENAANLIKGQAVAWLSAANLIASRRRAVGESTNG